LLLRIGYFSPEVSGRKYVGASKDYHLLNGIAGSNSYFMLFADLMGSPFNILIGSFSLLGIYNVQIMESLYVFRTSCDPVGVKYKYDDLFSVALEI